MDGKVSEELRKHVKHRKAKYELIDELMDIPGNTRDGIIVQVKWLRLPDKRDWTWQRLEELLEDVSERVKEYLSTCKKNRDGKAAKSALGLNFSKETGLQSHGAL